MRFETRMFYITVSLLITHSSSSDRLNGRCSFVFIASMATFTTFFNQKYFSVLKPAKIIFHRLLLWPGLSPNSNKRLANRFIRLFDASWQNLL